MTSKSRALSRSINDNNTINKNYVTADLTEMIVVSSADDLPVSGNTQGDQGYVTATNRLYLWSGSGWYNIALINTSPYYTTSPAGSYELNTDGTATTITINAVDSEGLPISFTAITDSDFDTFATITKDSDNGRIFTVTPDSENEAPSASNSGNVTFRASDGVNQTDAVSSFTLTFSNIVDNSAETIILLKADSDAANNAAITYQNSSDVSTGFTENGTPQASTFTPYRSGGYSVYFDGSGDYLDISASTDFQFGTGAFTVECWFYAEDLDHNGGSLYPHLVCINSYTNGIYLRPKHDGTLYEVYVGNTRYTFTTTIEENVWTHVAAVRDASGNLKLFENGTQIGSTQTGVNYNISTNSSGNRIGSAIHAAGEEFKGYIRDVRVTNTAVYSSDFTAPTETLTAITGTKLLTCHLPYIADGSFVHPITQNGDPETKPFGPYDYEPWTADDHGGSVYFDGSYDYLVPSITTAVGTSDFTLEGWFYPTSTASDTTIFDFRSSGNWGIFSLLSNNTVAYYNGSSTVGTTSITVTDNEWNHIAIVRNSGSVKIYINGALGSTTSDTTSWTLAASPRIGGNKGNSAWMNGYIADVRFISGTAVYTAAFTPPTAPLSHLTNTVLLMNNKSDANIYDAAAANRVTLNSTTSSTTQRKFTTSSAFYHPSGAYNIEIPTDERHTIGSQDFTVECWARFDTVAVEFKLL